MNGYLRGIGIGTMMTALAFGLGFADEFTPPVKTSSGPVIGKIEGDISSFKGVAYALPPQGELRWKAPQPMKPWPNPLLVTAFAPTCPQMLTRATIANPMTSTDAFGPVGSLSEDCLYLNVWAPQKADGSLPVFFWIHGGGFQAGSGSQPMYDGANLAKKGAIVVTIDFRTGSLGFLAHPDLTAESPDKTSGNYGLLDILAALKWVNANAAAFGGDPKKITLIGQSGGGVTVLSLMASPAAKGLFHRVICHSGMMMPQWRYRDKAQGALTSTETLGLGFGERVGVAPGAAAPAQLRALSWQQVLQANRAPMGPNDGSVANMGGNGLECTLEVDGQTILEPPQSTFAAGHQEAVPLLIGNVEGEGTTFVPPFDTLERYKELVAQAVGAANVDEALKTYPAADVTAAKKVYSQMCTDMMLAISRRHARWNSAKQPDTYLFFFSRTPPWESGKWFGCFHGSDLPYVFGNFLVPSGYTAQDRKLSDEMMAYWVQFANTGNPNVKGNPDWPAYQSASDSYLDIDLKTGAKTHLQDKICDLWDKWTEAPK